MTTATLIEREWTDEHGVHGTATFDPAGTYRYDLTRRWAPGPLVAFVMLNPSKADHRRADPTMTRCCGFARAWGYSGVILRNLFGYRATDPRELAACLDPVGPHNDDFLRDLVQDAPMVVAAWGAGGKLYGRQHEVRLILGAHPDVRALGTTKDGQPRHPLYLARHLAPIRLGSSR